MQIIRRLYETSKSPIIQKIKHQMSESHSVNPFVITRIVNNITVKEQKPTQKSFGMMSESHSVTCYKKVDPQNNKK